MNKGYLIVLLGLALAGCGDYPGHRPGDALKMSQKANWGDVVGQAIALGGDCHIDSINDEPGEGRTSYTVKQSEPLKIVGWGAISAKDGVVTSDIAVALKDYSPLGVRLFATTSKGKRPDVAAYFKNPTSVDSGFSALIDLSDVPTGNYVLEVIQHKDGKDLKCQYTANITIVNS